MFDRRPDPLLRLLLLRTALVRRLDVGDELQSRDDFPAPVPALLAAIEGGADPRRSIDAAIDLLRCRARIRSRMRTAMLYPLLCAAVLALVTIGFLSAAPLWSAHAIDDAIAGSSALREAAHFVTSSPVVRWALALVVGAVLVALIKTLRDAPHSPAAGRRKLDLPAIGRLERLAAASAFTGALAELLAVGRRIEIAVREAAGASGNAWVQARLRARLADVVDGDSLAEALRLPGVFPPSLGERLRVGCRSGRLSEALRSASRAYADDLAIYGARLARLIEPTGIVIVGLAAAFAVWLWFDLSYTSAWEMW